jgi:hypothetical protein
MIRPGAALAASGIAAAALDAFAALCDAGAAPAVR